MELTWNALPTNEGVFFGYAVVGLIVTMIIMVAAAHAGELWSVLGAIIGYVLGFVGLLVAQAIYPSDDSTRPIIIGGIIGYLAGFVVSGIISLFRKGR